MSHGSRFASVRSLFSGRPLPQPREDEDEPRGAQAGGNRDDAGPTEDQVTALVTAERNTASTEATTAANARWNTVMTSDAGIANPKAAARALSTSTMAADDIVAMLDDMTPATPAPQKSAEELRREQQEADRQRLASDANAKPDTGPVGGNAAERRGEGKEASSTSIRERREKRGKDRAAGAERTGGRFANAAQG